MLRSQFSTDKILWDTACESRNDTTNYANYWLGPEGQSNSRIIIDLTCSRLMKRITLKNGYNFNYTDRYKGNSLDSTSSLTSLVLVSVLLRTLPSTSRLTSRLGSQS